MFKKMLIVVAASIALLLVFAATRPGDFRVEESMEISAPQGTVYAIVHDFKRFNDWSPWAGLDPAMTSTVTGEGVGSTYEWSGNDNVGTGKMTVTEASAPGTIRQTIEFVTPFESTSVTGYDLTEAGVTGTKITWWMTGNNDYMAKLVGVFMDIEGGIHSDFKRGLKKLKAVAEKDAKAEEEAAVIEAQSEAAEAARDAGPPSDGG